VSDHGITRVRDRLAGRKLLLTGATGFLGKAVLASLLRHAPDFRTLVVLVRASSSEAARRRLLEEVLPAEAFAGLSASDLLADVESGRIVPVAGTLETPEGLGSGHEQLWGGVDVVIHCAATVSFEEPLDDALALNTQGPARLHARLEGAGSRPHFVHVSTAYVAERRNGEVTEDGALGGAVEALDPDALLADARGWREQTEAESEGRRGAFAREAERDAARREGLDAGERAEGLRGRWVLRRLSELGHERANELGWPDTYALSKALGERLLCARSASTTVIRPTIIESALSQPFPGWLEGIKVADPLILAYAARGLTHLPGRRGNRIDIVPVDHVANACVAAAAHPPERPRRNIAIASSARNPLAIGELADQIKRYFRKEPLLHRNGSPIEIGDLRFVDRSVAMRRTLRRERLAAALARAAMASPVKLPQERALRGTRTLAERVTRMVRIYGAYTELDCAFDDANACALGRSLATEDRRELPFDTAAIDWDRYLQEIHLPQVRRLAAEG
jgi:thioester reductase-like protein